MLKQKNIFLDGEKVTREDLEDDGEGDGGRFWKKIMDNAEHVGLNCLTWTMEKDGYFLRVKVYLKLAQEFEKASVRSSVGNHQNDWMSSRATSPPAGAGRERHGATRGMCKASIPVTAHSRHLISPTHTHLASVRRSQGAHSNQRVEPTHRWLPIVYLPTPQTLAHSVQAGPFLSARCWLAS